MAHLVPSNIELANFHTFSQLLVQLLNFHVPGVFVSSLESNFLVPWDCKLATAQVTFIAPFCLHQLLSPSICFPIWSTNFPAAWFQEFCLVIFGDSTTLWFAFHSSVQGGGSSRSLHYLNNYHSVTLYCMLQPIEPPNEPVVFVVK